MIDVRLLSGISGLSFDSPVLSPLFFLKILQYLLLGDRYYYIYMSCVEQLGGDGL